MSGILVSFGKCPDYHCQYVLVHNPRTGKGLYPVSIAGSFTHGLTRAFHLELFFPFFPIIPKSEVQEGFYLQLVKSLKGQYGFKLRLTAGLCLPRPLTTAPRT